MKSFVCLALVVLALLGEQVATAAVTGRRPIKARLTVDDPNADEIVDNALASVSSQLKETAGFDPSPFDEVLYGLNFVGSTTGLSNLARTTEAEIQRDRKGTKLVFEFSVQFVVANFGITSDTDSSFSAMGGIIVSTASVECTATRQRDGSYRLTEYQPQPITKISTVLTDLGQYNQYLTGIQTSMSDFTVDTINAAVDDNIYDLLNDALSKGH